MDRVATCSQMHLCAISKNNWQTKRRCLLSMTALSMTPLAKWPMFHLSLKSCRQNEMHPSLTSIMELKDNSKLPFLGMVIIRNGSGQNMKVYVKPTDIGLLVHNQSHVDVKYKHNSAEGIMSNWVLKLSSNWQFFQFFLQLSWNPHREHHQTLYWNENY